MKMKKILYVLFLLLAYVGYAQDSRTITGKVIDINDKLPIPGASIYVENKSISNSTKQAGIIQSESIGTITDMDGNFELKIKNDITTLRVSFMGYQPYTIEVTAQINCKTWSLQAIKKLKKENLPLL